MSENGRPVVMPLDVAMLRAHILDTGLHLHVRGYGSKRKSRTQATWMLALNHTKLCGTSRCLRIPLKVTG